MKELDFSKHSARGLSYALLYDAIDHENANFAVATPKSERLDDVMGEERWPWIEEENKYRRFFEPTPDEQLSQGKWNGLTGRSIMEEMFDSALALFVEATPLGRIRQRSERRQLSADAARELAGKYRQEALMAWRKKNDALIADLLIDPPLSRRRTPCPKPSTRASTSA